MMKDGLLRTMKDGLLQGTENCREVLVGIFFSKRFGPELTTKWLCNSTIPLIHHYIIEHYTIISSSNFLRFAIIEHQMDTIFLLVNLA